MKTRPNAQKPATVGRLIGYARVSTADQNTHLQIDALLAAGCQALYEDRITGISHCREGLDAALLDVQAGGMAAGSTGPLNPTCDVDHRGVG